MIHVLSYVVLVALMIVILVVPELLLVIVDVIISSLFLVPCRSAGSLVVLVVLFVLVVLRCLHGVLVFSSSYKLL